MRGWMVGIGMAAGMIALIAHHAPPAHAADDGTGMSRAEAFKQAAELSALGRKMFHDRSLSASGLTSCASCHDPAHGFAPANALPVQLGGTDGHQPGTRAAPSLTYIQATPQFSEHFFDSDDEADDSIDNGPTGGLTWDGRVDQGRDQVLIPLLSANEMADGDVATLYARLKASGNLDALGGILGKEAVANPEKAANAAGQAFEAYEQDSATFYPYSSKYDAYLAGSATLTPQEQHGLSLFEDPDKGNCASCHISAPARDGEPPQFTDYGLIALGLPRNDAIPANHDPAYDDLGLCGPVRTDLKDHPEYCGLFKTPSLRNVALRQSFFHNGIFHTLTDAVRFYVQRDTDPAKFYPRNPDGSVKKYDDLPSQYWDNLNADPPFGGKEGDKPALSDAEIADVVAFLGTLTDGYEAPAKSP